MSLTRFISALTSAYIDNPCKIQPTALWKTLKEVDSLHFDYRINDQGETIKLKVWSDTVLYCYWDNNTNKVDITNLNTYNHQAILLHESQLNEEIMSPFTNIKAYFKLIHNHHCELPNIVVPKGFYIRDVDFATELQLVSDVICQCYKNIKPNVKEVYKWTKHPVYDKSLWIWIIDNETDKPAALGIAELDKRINEGSLEWIQVLPAYQGKKLGKTLISELLTRLAPIANFTTVAGEIDNETNPERVYRSCGFTGNDRWYVLRR